MGSVIDFSTNNNMVIKSTYFPHKNIHDKTWQSPEEKTNNQIYHVLVVGRLVKHYGCKKLQKCSLRLRSLSSLMMYKELNNVKV